MRNSVTLTIDGHDRPVELKELTVREIISLTNMAGGEEGGKDKKPLSDLESFMGFLDAEVLPKVTNLKMSQLQDFTPGELKQIFEKFQEVNQSFFDLAGAMGLGALLDEMKQAILIDFSRTLVSSLNPDTEESSSMDSLTS